MPESTCANATQLTLYYKTCLWYLQGINNHSRHGAGQGTGDAVLWCQCNQTVYFAHTSPSQLPGSSVTLHAQHSCSKTLLAGFVADVDLITNCTGHNHTQLRLWAQHNLQMWQDILTVSGGSLNPPKCSWAHFKRSFDQYGNATLIKTLHTLGISVTVNGTSRKLPIAFYGSFSFPNIHPGRQSNHGWIGFSDQSFMEVGLFH